MSRPTRSDGLSCKVTVVGNAPVLPDPARVEDIQSSDLVIRVNCLALDEPGGLPQVGTRCNVLLASRYAPVTPWTFRDYKRRAYLIPQAGVRRALQSDAAAALLALRPRGTPRSLRPGSSRSFSSATTGA